MSLKRVVVITGCDSGLGWAVAARSAREGLITIAGMYRGTETKAAEALKNLRAFPHQIDITNWASVIKFREYVNSIIEDNPSYKLHAVVNNAGVMTIGDFEYQTPAIIENTINVNLIGSMRVAIVFLPDLRKSVTEGSKPRLINVASHCGLQPLPGFAPYSASKAGLLAWTHALRSECRDHGMSAVAFVPGGFISSSNIISNQISNANIMLEHLNEDQKSFYERKIKTLSKYLQLATNNGGSFDSLKDENIIETFMKALLDDNPKELYKVEPWRYFFYYNMLKLPVTEEVRQWLLKRFINFPE